MKKQLFLICFSGVIFIALCGLLCFAYLKNNENNTKRIISGEEIFSNIIEMNPNQIKVLGFDETVHYINDSDTIRLVIDELSESKYSLYPEDEEIPAGAYFVEFLQGNESCEIALNLNLVGINGKLYVVESEYLNKSVEIVRNTITED